MKRSPLRRRTPLRRSVKGRARPKEPMAAWCEIHLAGCYGIPTDRHHKLPRSHGGRDDRGSTMDLCRYCHRYVHANPALAYEHGWLIRSAA